MDTRAEADSLEAKANRDVAIETVRRDSVAKFFASMSQKVLGQTTLATQPAVLTRVNTIAHRQKPAAVIAALGALRDRTDSSHDLEKIHIPTLVIVGEEDVVTPPGLSEAMVKRLPNGRLATIPHAGHLANLERPSEFNAAIRNWLNSTRGS